MSVVSQDPARNRLAGAGARDGDWIVRLWESNYMVRSVEDLTTVLFDSRRNVCQSLVLNYWVSYGGLGVLVDAFKRETDALWAAISREETMPETTADAAEVTSAPSAGGQQGSKGGYPFRDSGSR